MESKVMCSVVLEETDDILSDKKSVDIGKGENVTFVLTRKNGCIVLETDYEDYTLTESGEKILLTLKNVRYSTIVKLSTTYEYRVYFPNGGEGEKVQENILKSVKNTSIQAFEREGYIQNGWNTRADGKGEHIGFGSRTACRELYAQWEKISGVEQFIFIESDETIKITGYLGEGEKCVLPDKINGKKVRVICSGAFVNSEFTEFICSDTVQTIEPDAFKNAKIKKITLFDNIIHISDESFNGCSINTLCINAKRKPVYAGSYFSAFPDKCERLFSIQEKKIVLFSGSSARYGYDSKKIDEAFQNYDVVNMGTYAYTNALPQLELIYQAMNEGDILLEAPEFDATNQQFCESNEMDRFFFALVEEDYKLLEYLDIKRYRNVFDAFGEYLYEHGRMQEKSYFDLALEYDDNGNQTSYSTYNEYGDYVIERPNSKTDEMHRIIPADYTTDTITIGCLIALNQELTRFTQKGVKVLFTYAPRNRSSLTEKSTEDEMETLEEQIKSVLSIPIISDMKKYLYSGIYFYEIDNHLSNEGVILRTNQVIHDMKQWMEKCE